LAKVLICNHSFEVLFHAVQDSYIKYDALIGREILSQGIGVTITYNSLPMFNENTVLPILTSDGVPDLANVIPI